MGTAGPSAPGSWLRAGLHACIVRSLTRLASVRVAAREILDGAVTHQHVSWATERGWEHCGPKTAPGPAGQDRHPTPDHELAWYLHALAAVMDLQRLSLEPRGWLTQRADDRSVPRQMARQAVTRLGPEAGHWIRAWTAAGHRIGDRGLYIAWLRLHAVPYMRDRPADADPAGWALSTVEYADAGLTTAEWLRTRTRPDGDPAKPTLDSVAALAALLR